MNNPVCPVCRSAESVTVLKSGKRAFCENCESTFDVPPPEPGERKKPLRLFLSYPHAAEGEYNICDDIAAYLMSRGHDVWFDKDQLNRLHGTDWRRKIADGIRSSQLVLSCLNRHAVRVEAGQRGVCLDELSIAISVKGGNINTVLLEPESVIRMSAALSHRQWLDMSAWRKKYESGETVFRPWLKQKLEELARMVESDENYSFDGEITEIARKLGMTDYRLDKRELLEKPFIGREWLAAEVDSWLNDPGKGRLCAVYGDPGVGKSAFAVQYAFASPHVGAFMCFEYGNSHYNSVSAMVYAIAYQLACRLSDYRAELLRVLEMPGVLSLEDTELFDQLLIKPLTMRHIDGNQETLCVILDGLDECGEGEKNVVAAVLGRCAERFPAWLRILVTSRREAAVLEQLAPDYVLELRGQDGNNLADVRRYYLQTLKECIPDEKKLKQTVDHLTARSNGAFLYACLTAEAIRAGLLDPDDEAAYPVRLSQTLDFWLRRIFPDSREYREKYRLPVGSILASPEPLPEEELERLLGLNGTDVMDLKRRLRVFLTESTNDFGAPALAFGHRYVRDWLSGGTAGVFSVSRKDAVKAMAQGCYLQFSRNPVRLSGFETVRILDLLEQAGMDLELNEALQSRRLLIATDDLCRWCLSRGKTAAASGLADSLLRISFARAESLNTSESERDLAIGYERLAEIRSGQGKPAQALELLQKAAAIHETLAKELNTSLSRRDLSVIYIRTGRMQQDLGKPEEALALYQRAMCISESLADGSGLPESRRDLLVCCGLAAEIYREQRNPEKALELLRKALRISEALAAETGTPESRRDLSVSYSRLAGILQAQGKTDEALELFMKDLRISEALAEDSGTPESRLDLSVSYERIAGIYLDQGKPDKALELYLKSLRICEELAGELNTPEALRNLSAGCENTAEVYLDLGNRAKALELYRKALAISEALAEESEAPGSLWDLIVSHYHLGFCLEMMGRPAEALEHYRKALELGRELVRSCPQYGSDLDIIREACLRLES